MNTYYITFGQASSMKDHWIEVIAPTERDARLYASQFPHWCGCYTPENWKPEYFSKGCLETVRLGALQENL